MRNISEIIRKYVIDCELSTRDLAERSNTHHARIHKIRTDQITPSTAEIDALAEYFGLTLTPKRKPQKKASGWTPVSKHDRRRK